MNCPERERLFEAVSAAVTEHHKRLSRLQGTSAIQNHSTLTAENAEAAESFEAARAAWTAYLNHIREHRCSAGRNGSAELTEATTMFTSV